MKLANQPETDGEVEDEKEVKTLSGIFYAAPRAPGYTGPRYGLMRFREIGMRVLHFSALGSAVRCATHNPSRAMVPALKDLERSF